ncbi:MAG: archease [bacterium]|nr:archease [bacterium]
MQKYEFFDHESDVGVKVEADNISNLFAGSAEALFNLIGRKIERGKKFHFDIDLSAESMEELLVSWLNELIFRFEAEDLFCKEFITKISERDQKYFINAQIRGEKIIWGSDEIHHEVKSATYHQLKVVEKEGKYSVKIVFDL